MNKRKKKEVKMEGSAREILLSFVTGAFKKAPK